MADVAALGLRVDGIDGIDKAAASLDNFAKSGKSAGDAASGLATTTKASKAPIAEAGAAADKAAIAEQRLAAAAERAGMSAKAMSAALRGVPAQFTDIAVSLQGGQNPLTVFLQQGGQLKDMFGGAGAAARALGGYVLGLVTPFTVAAAAATALAVAAFQGSREQDAYVKSLAMTGNAAGVTASSLQAYAKQISEVTGTQGAAAAGLVEFINAGVRGEEQLRQYTATALAWSKATGEGVDVVAQRFSALQNDPLKASLKLNESTNFLTASIYEQIRSLEEQGNKTEAARVAMDALDASMKSGAASINQNLGSLERAWNGVAGAAKWAWDSMLNLGRQATLVDKLSSAQEKLNKLESETVGLYERGTYSKRLKDQQALVWGLMGEVAAEEALAAGKKESARQVAEADENAKKAKKTDEEWAGIVKRNLTDQQRLRVDLDKIRDVGLKKGLAENVILAEQNKLQAEFDKKNKAKPKGGGTAGVSELAGIMSRVKATNDYIKALQEQGKEANKITEGERLANKIQGEIDSGRLKSAQLINKQKELEAAKMLQTAQEALQAEEKRQKAVKLSAEMAKAAALDKFNLEVQLGERLRAFQEANEAELSAYGVGDKAAKESAARIALQQKQQKDLRDLEKEHGAEMRKAETDQQREHLQSMYAERLSLTQAALSTEMMEFERTTARKKELDKDWTLGAQSAIQNYIEKTQDSYTVARDSTMSMMNTIEGAFVNLFTLGESSFKSFVSTILKGIAQMAAQKAASGIAGFLGTAINAYIGGGASVGASAGSYSGAAFGSYSGFSQGGYTGPGGKNDPAGIVHRGEVVFSQADVARHGGPSAVDQMRRGGASAAERIGTRQATSGSSAGRSSGSGGQGNITVVNQTTGRVDNIERKQLTEDDVLLIIQEQTPKVMVSQTQNANSPFSRTMAGSYNTSRRR